MWPYIVVPVAALIGKAIYDLVNEAEDISPADWQSVLETNLERLGQELSLQSAPKVAILGQPGAGKSSLLKKMTKGQVTPLPIVGTQTDATDWSKDAACNLLSRYKNHIFVDVPGYDTEAHPVTAFQSLFPFAHVDSFIFVVSGKLHGADQEIFRLVRQTGKPVVIARLFSDGLEPGSALAVEADIRQRLSANASVPLVFCSNRTGDGLDEVLAISQRRRAV